MLQIVTGKQVAYTSSVKQQVIAYMNERHTAYHAAMRITVVATVWAN